LCSFERCLKASNGNGGHRRQRGWDESTDFLPRDRGGLISPDAAEVAGLRHGYESWLSLELGL